MPITPQNGDLNAGVAAHSSEVINPSPDPLITGDAPALSATDEVVATGVVLPALSVVGFDANGEIVEALIDTANPANSIQAIGVLVYDVDASGGAVGAAVYRQGVLNPDRLNWHASFATDADKRKAFEGAPSPTSIILRKPVWNSV